MKALFENMCSLGQLKMKTIPFTGLQAKVHAEMEYSHVVLKVL